MQSISKLSDMQEGDTINRDVSSHWEAQPIRLVHNNSAAFTVYKSRWQFAFLTYSDAQDVIKISGMSASLNFTIQAI